MATNPYQPAFDLSEAEHYRNYYMIFSSILTLFPITIWHVWNNSLADLIGVSISEPGFKLSCFSHFFVWSPYTIIYLLREVSDFDKTGDALWTAAIFSLTGPFFF